MEQVIETLPDLYCKTSKNQVKIWKSRILSSNNKGIYEIEFGLEHGKLQLVRREFTEGKNIGKKNETTPLQQALAELHKKWKDKQSKEGYCLQNEQNQKQKIAPMLAQSYTPNKSKKNDIQFPCFTQPKLDGLRCLIYLENGQVITQSRTGNHFEHLDSIKQSVLPFLQKHPTIILDGELYTTDFPFENLAGLIKKKKVNQQDLSNLDKIQYHIYDYICDLPFKERNSNLNLFQRELNSPFIRFVATFIVHNQTEFYDKFQEFITDGYEGAMLRNIKGLYKQNYRSFDLQKYKEFHEDEYTIIDFKQGEGRDEGTIIWICETPSKKQFSVRPKGSIEYRKQLYENGNQYIGQLLTVIYQELTDMGIPRFPVGKYVRHD